MMIAAAMPNEIASRASLIPGPCGLEDITTV
jgi:hypothetical protein